MRALRFHGPGDVRLDEVAEPRPVPGEVLLRVLACGICGSDALEYRQGPVLIDRAPVTLGHEFAGEVVAGDLPAGTLVACGAGMSCGACAPCRAGRTNLCARYATIGFHRDGGLAEYCTAPADICFDAGGLTPDAAALAQPMAIAVHAARRGRVDEARTAMVIGAGGIGALIAFVAASWGARVLVRDLDSERLALACALGAVDELDGPPDVVLEASGSAAGLAAAIDVVPRGGRVVAVGVQKAPPEVDMRRVTLDEIEVIGTVAHVAAADMPEALRLLASRAEGWGDVAPIALGLDDAIEHGIVPLAEGRSEHVKTLIDPWATATRPTTTEPMGAAA